MSDSPFGFERVQPKQTKLIPGGNTAVVFMVYHKTQPFLCLKNDPFFFMHFSCPSSLQEQANKQKRKVLFIFIGILSLFLGSILIY
jgi:hypothetical protein